MYEFSVAAINAVGVGAWSDPSYPIATLTNHQNVPVNRSLQIAPVSIFKRRRERASRIWKSTVD